MRWIVADELCQVGQFYLNVQRLLKCVIVEQLSIVSYTDSSTEDCFECFSQLIRHVSLARSYQLPSAAKMKIPEGD